MASSSNIQTEAKLSLQTIHQCANLISIKLSNNNYLLWRSQVLHLISNLGLNNHISDDSPPQTISNNGKSIANPDFSVWAHNDGLLLTWLRGMMMEDVLTLVVGGQTVKEVWLSIEENMLPATKDLATIGKPLTDDDKVFQLAWALRPKYANFKTAMLTKPPYPSLKLFLSALQNHEQTVIAQKNDGKEADP
ncbi:hypothetical protein AB3S75_039980 [Citrus x aurantiifolia]